MDEGVREREKWMNRRRIYSEEDGWTQKDDQGVGEDGWRNGWQEEDVEMDEYDKVRSGWIEDGKGMDEDGAGKKDERLED